MSVPSKLLEAASSMLVSAPGVEALVLFGSMSRPVGVAGASDDHSDVDFHLIVSSPARLVDFDWARLSPSGCLIHKCIRTAAGGVEKVTLMYDDGVVDIVIIPSYLARIAWFLLFVGVAERLSGVVVPLNNLSTIMRGGYRFLKGARKWGGFYSRVVEELPGFRISDQHAVRMADVAVCDLAWVQQKLERGELVAAQRVLHRFVLETNIELLHELRTRRGAVSFQQARRAEFLLGGAEMSCISVDAALDAHDIRRESVRLFNGLLYVMSYLVPEWTVSQGATVRILRRGSG